MSKHKSYNYIVIGAGSSGATLAARLSEKSDATVLLLEAGKWDRDLLLRIPMLWARNAFARRNDWGYTSEPEAALIGQALPMFRGKLVGGSSSTNAMTYARGHRADFDRWASYGLPDWSYENVLPYFKKSETWQGGEDAYRGGSGELQTAVSHFDDPLGQALIAAGLEAGYQSTPDYNGEQQEGFSVAQLTVVNGRRCSTADAFLHHATSRPNLDVEVEAHVTRLVLEKGRAVAVEYVQGGKPRRVGCDCEIVLSAGAINSPQILMLSGIGVPSQLMAHGIKVNTSLPVGQNLQEHVTVDVGYTRKTPGRLHREMRADRAISGVVKAYLWGKGMYTSVPNHILAHLRIGPDAKIPDVQMAFRMGPSGAKPYFPGLVPDYQDGFGCRPVVMRTQSRGEITLATTDPLGAPRITLNLLQSDSDRRLLRTAIRAAREIMAQPALGAFISREIGPGADAVSDGDLDQYIDRGAMSYVHPLGTCKMGSKDDDTAVVDAELRVRGVAGLRVADASVMPDHLGANLNAPAIMVAEKAADMILHRSLG